MAKPLANAFTWSHSRDRLFRRCLRAYYYHYYGAWGGWERDAPPETKKLYYLKRLENRFMLAGSVVHAVIADVLNSTRYGKETPLDAAKEDASRRLRAAFKESRDGAYRERKAVGLFEHEYELDLPDEAWQGMRDRPLRCVENFYTSRIRTVILQTPVERWMPIETLDSFIFHGVKIWVALDFAMKNDRGNMVVIDWKTGKPGEGADRTQIVCYGLFVEKKWKIGPKKTIGELHYLLSGDIEIVTLDYDTVEQGRAHISDSIRAMQDLLDDAGKNTAKIERFPKTDDRLTCRHCNFRKVCWPEWPRIGEEGE